MLSSHDIITQVFPAITIRGIVPLPANEIRLDVGREKNLMAIKEAMLTQEKGIVILVQKNFTTENPKPDDLETMGVLGKVVFNMEAGVVHKVKIDAIVRCQVIEYTEFEPFYRVQVVTKPSYSSDVSQELACIRLLISELDKNGATIFRNNAEVLQKVSEGVTGDILTDLLAYHLPLDFNTKMKYLNTDNTSERVKYIFEDVKREKYLKSIEDNIDSEVRKVINENQKEYYLREKMKVIQDELGDKVKKDTEIDELRKKILDCKMPKEIEEKALNELARYSSLGMSSGESGIIRTYLDFLIALPWSNASEDCHDIKKAKEQLDKDHYGLDKV